MVRQIETRTLYLFDLFLDKNRLDTFCEDDVSYLTKHIQKQDEFDGFIMFFQVLAQLNSGIFAWFCLKNNKNVS